MRDAPGGRRLKTGSKTWKRRVFGIAALVLFASLNVAAVEEPADFAFAQAGFNVQKIAGSSEANNIFCMTLDARGRVVAVSYTHLPLPTTHYV